MVTHAGGKELEEPLVVRPTSETIIGEMMAKWISSHRDLPLLLNQWANVVRWELRPRMFLRTTEFLWQEGHTAHVDEADAMRETMLALDIYAEVARDIAAIPVVPGEKTPGERFAGAVATFTIEGMMRDGRALQAGTSHYLGDQLRHGLRHPVHQPSGGTRAYAHTTSWGMSTRMIGGVIMTHGDDKGLVLPPRLAPHQVVIVPIGRGDNVAVEGAADEPGPPPAGRRGADPRRRPAAASPRVQVQRLGDARRPGPARAGPARSEAGTVMMARRLGDDGKEAVPIDSLPETMPRGPRRLPGLPAAAGHRVPRRPHPTVDDWEDFAKAVSTGWALALHCGIAACEDEIKSETAATPRCIPLGGEPEAGACVRCGAASAYGKRVIFGRAY